MRQPTTNPGAEGFEKEAEKYAAYLQTPEGRLRLDLPFANLQEVLPRVTDSRPQGLRALDVGGGTGTQTVRLAQLGFQVTLLDPSPQMLQFAKRASEQANLTENVTLIHGEASQLKDFFDAGSFDVVLCHNVLEFIDDPVTVLRDIARLMRDPSAVLSVLARSRTGEVFKAALQTGDLAAAEAGLTSQWGQESLYGGKVYLFTQMRLQDVLKAASLTMLGWRGVRVLADYLPPKISRTAEYDRIFALERKLGKHRDFARVARYIQCLACRTGS